MTKEERLDLALKPIWNNQDIMKFFEIGKTKASQIRQVAIKRYGGSVALQGKEVYAISVFKAQGLVYENYVKLLTSVTRKEISDVQI